jgi:hypothetical protein
LENLFHAVFGSDEVCEAEVLKFALLFGSWVVRKQNRNISSEVVLQPFCIVMVAMKV